MAPTIAALCRSTTAIAFRRAVLTDGRGVLSLSVTLPLADYLHQAISVLARDGGGKIVAFNVEGAALFAWGRGFRYASPPNVDGVARLTIHRDRHGTSTVKLTTRRAWTSPGADEDAAATEVVLNVGGRCFRGSATRVR